ncbi:MAG: glycosyltransferase [Thermoleophilia bacterium]|nr:glycosyltransferase [Thermoleophilia bacterium]
MLDLLAEAVGRQALFVDDDGELVYAPSSPSNPDAVWIPLERDCQAFFEREDPFPGDGTHRAAGLDYLFPPATRSGPFAGDIVASAFYLLSRWDELHVAERDRFDRLPLGASAFGRIAGLELERPLVEDYIAALRDVLGIDPPSEWSVAITHDIDRIRRRTPRSVAGMLRRGSLGAVASLAFGDPWNNIPDLLEAAGRRGTAPTVFFIGRNQNRLDGTPRRTYERTRRHMARAVAAAGGEVGLHASFASSESAEALAEELTALRDEVGEILGVRFHYLRFRYHETVRWLEQAGVTYDASLGFSEAPGFACGIARPFRPWLVGEERAAELTLVPLAVMDTTLHRQLGLAADEAKQRALGVLDVVRHAGGRASLLWHNTYLADERAQGYGPLWAELLDELRSAGAAIGPVRPPAGPRGGRLDGRRAIHLTSVHQPTDIRISHKEVHALRRAGADARVLALARKPGRARRLIGGWRLMQKASELDADIYHVHDPELLPAALWLSRRTGRPVVYDVHEYLGRTARTKAWLPAPARLPIALVAERAEQWLASRLAGVVTANPDLAARFANSGARATPVDNSPWSDEFSEPATLPSEPRVIYIGGIGVHRGIGLMREAFPLVQAAGAVLRLVGPGDPGALPAGVEATGPVPPEDVPRQLAWCKVAWIPIQASHGNMSRPVVPTKLFEAMAAARPVVVSDIGLMGQIVRSARCGIAVPAADAQAHADALTHILESPEAEQMGLRARAAFVEQFGFERQADQLVELYREILGD